MPSQQFVNELSFWELYNALFPFNMALDGMCSRIDILLVLN